MMEDFFMQRSVFLRWLIFVTLVSCGVISAVLRDWHWELYEGDSTGISWFILVLLAVLTFKVGGDSYRLSSVVEGDGLFPIDERTDFKIAKLYTETTIFVFAASIFLGLGLLGTTLGIINMLDGFEFVKPSDFGSMVALMKSLGSGFGVALYTTAVGLVCSILMKVQCENIRYEIRCFRDKQRYE
jgi:hypothetical protein